MQRKWQGFVSRGCWLHPIFPIGICQTSFLPLRARKHSPGWDAAAAPTAVRVTPGSHLRLDRKPTRASTAHQLIRGAPWAEVWWDNNNGKRNLVLWMALWENVRRSLCLLFHLLSLTLQLFQCALKWSWNMRVFFFGIPHSDYAMSSGRSHRLLWNVTYLLWGEICFVVKHGFSFSVCIMDSCLKFAVNNNKKKVFLSEEKAPGRPHSVLPILEGSTPVYRGR